MLVLAAVCLLAAGCGGGDGSAGDALRETAAKLGKIRSGDLAFRFTLSPHGAKGASDVGLTLTGPFAFRGKGELPILGVTYTRIAGSQRTTARLDSDGRSAKVVQDGRTVTLTAAQAASLERAGGSGLGGLGVDPSRWIDHAKLASGPSLDGAATDRITGDLDAEATARDLLAAAGRSGAGGGLDAKDARRLKDAVRSSSVEVITGHGDRLLRRLSVTVTLDVPPELRGRVPGATALDMQLRFAVAKPNRPVSVGHG